MAIFNSYVSHYQRVLVVCASLFVVLQGRDMFLVCNLGLCWLLFAGKHLVCLLVKTCVVQPSYTLW